MTRSGDPYTEKMNAMPKHVASRSDRRSGQHLLDDVAPTHLEFVDVTRIGAGIVVLTYAPTQ